MAKAKTTTKAKKTTAKKATTKKPEVKLNPVVWAVEYNPDLVAQVVYVQRSNARVGTANAKTRSDVRGGGRKPWKQKGTGRARAGSIRSPLWRKGGVIFPPTNRNWSRKINRKMARKAVCMMLTNRLGEERLQFVNMPSKSDMGKIREGVLKTVGKGRSALVVSENANVKMALSNVPKVSVLRPSDLNAYSLVKAREILVENDSVDIIEKQFGNEK